MNIKNFFITMLFCFTSSLSQAALPQAQPKCEQSAKTNIITTDFATGMRRYKNFNNDTNGNMVVCTSGMTITYECHVWTPITQLVPNGKTFVGFQIINYNTIDIYWK